MPVVYHKKALKEAIKSIKTNVCALGLGTRGIFYGALLKEV